MNPTQFVQFAGTYPLRNTVITVNYLFSFFANSAFNNLSTDVVFRGSPFTNFFIDSAKTCEHAVRSATSSDVFNANRILHDFKIPYLRLLKKHLEHSKFVF